MTKPQIEAIVNWFYRAREGQLIFDDRPYVAYDVVVSSVTDGNLYNGKDATLTIKMKAFTPYGKMLYKATDAMDKDGAHVTTGIVEEACMPKLSLAAGDYLLYNPGTEYADTTIRLAGTAPNGVSIENRTTGAVCKLLAIPSSPDCLVIDSETCDVYLESAPEDHYFEAHDEGYIRLAPCVPYQRDVLITFSSGSNKITFSQGAITEDNIGQYLLLENEWYRIIAVTDDETAVLNKNLIKSGADVVLVATMNEITITADGATFTTLDIDYVPKTR